ncbi:MAG TPA: AfsR/SARP family transcriptional regulator, partial [Rugosimonospora sp.]|nr:AfsR/SARP family transcriptional regulator [Rugosimonospora sp.]
GVPNADGGGVRIQVLGPVRAWNGDTSIDLGPPAQRGLLGLLALAAGRPLSRDELVDALWKNRPPATATNVIQSYIRRLRRALEPGRPRYRPSALLPTVGNGYALDVPCHVVDALRFRSLVATAAVLQWEGRAERAAALLSEGLGMWQGPPLADVAFLADHPKAVAMTIERGAAQVRYGQALVSAGAWPDALPALQVAAADRPMDEAVHARLIRVYHVLGRRAEAFSTYHEIRRRLADELGVDPGAELSAAHAALLRGARR